MMSKYSLPVRSSQLLWFVPAALIVFVTFGFARGDSTPALAHGNRNVPVKGEKLKRNPDVDLILLASGGNRTKKKSCLVLGRYYSERLVVLEKGQVTSYPNRKVDQIVHTRRDQVAKFLGTRKPDATVDEAWAMVGTATGLGLHFLARVQAWDVISREPTHAEAHEFLGHKQRGDKWKWKERGKRVELESFEEHIADWKGRLVLESEHYVVEGNTGLRNTIDAVFDLEWLYLFWMDTFAQELKATEGPLLAQHKMTFHIHRSKEDKDFRKLNSAREPYYDPSRQYTTAAGDQNLVVTYNVDGSHWPARFFDLGVQQLMYTTLSFGHQLGSPPSSLDDRFSGWVELGIGYWMARQVGGSPGFPERIPFELEPEIARQSLAHLKSGPLSKSYVRREVTNLIGLPFKLLHGSGKHVGYYNAKAQSFVSFILEAKPKVGKGGKKLSVKTALMIYLQEDFGTPRGHSSSALDGYLKPNKIEMTTGPWREWLESQLP